MNERIRLLAEQAFFDDASGQPSDRMYTFSDHKMQKFAELIVRECVGVADDYVKDCTCDEHKNCKHPRSIIGRKIKEHFGVAE
jgi:hypothetical protein